MLILLVLALTGNSQEAIETFILSQLHHTHFTQETRAILAVVLVGAGILSVLGAGLGVGGKGTVVHVYLNSSWNFTNRYRT